MSASSPPPPPPPAPEIVEQHVQQHERGGGETLASQIARLAAFKDDEKIDFARPHSVGRQDNDNASTPMMRIVHVSDTHGRHADVDVPDGDVLVHSGDFSQRAKSEDEARDALAAICRWFESLPHKRVVLVGGNHEIGLSRFAVQDIRAMLPDKVTYLLDDGVEIDGVRFYGSPWTRSRRMGYSASDDEIQRHWRRIPVDTDVLVTHQPPFGIRDLARSNRGSAARCVDCGQVHKNQKHWGCRHLLKRLSKLNNLKVHCFGHVHECAGAQQIGTVLFSNGAADLTQKCVIIDYYTYHASAANGGKEKCNVQ